MKNNNQNVEVAATAKTVPTKKSKDNSFVLALKNIAILLEKGVTVEKMKNLLEEDKENEKKSTLLRSIGWTSKDKCIVVRIKQCYTHVRDSAVTAEKGIAKSISEKQWELLETLYNSLGAQEKGITETKITELLSLFD